MAVGNEGSERIPAGHSGPIPTGGAAPVGNPATVKSGGSGPIKK